MRGSFTGAHQSRKGLFREAEGGTLFLDEIGDMPLSLQIKLLRVFQERKVKPVGENTYYPINNRIIVATNKDLKLAIETGQFREDLFYRLNVITIVVPPLRERKEDIIPIAEIFLKKFSAMNNKSVKTLSNDAKNWLLENRWQGNVRELENTIERAVVLCEGAELKLADVSSNSELFTSAHEEHSHGFVANFDPAEKLEPLDTITNTYITHALKINGGSKEKTARDLGIDRKTLYRKLRLLNKNIAQ